MHIDVGKKTVALYARVSTMEQSCDMQLEDLRRYATRFARSYEYVEVGVSGAQRHRPELDALMKDARKRLFDVVLVWKFDRFARSVKHLVDSLEEFRALGIDFNQLHRRHRHNDAQRRTPVSHHGCGGAVRARLDR